MSSLLKRILSACILAPVILVPVWHGGEVFMCLLLTIGAVAGFEWIRLVEAKTEEKLKQGAWLAPIAVGTIILCTLKGSVALGLGVTLAIGFALYFYAQMFAARTNVWFLTLGLAYIGLSLASLMMVRGLLSGPLFNTVFLFLVVWASDIGAYFAGKTIGGPKLVPKLSPNKTWAGLAGGMAAAGAVAAGLVWYGLHYGDVYFQLINRAVTRPMLITVSYPNLVLVGAVLAVVGQVGDVMISAVKRHYDVKDTGALIPGHGGVLDRIDALLLTGPVFLIGLYIFLNVYFLDKSIF